MEDLPASIPFFLDLPNDDRDEAGAYKNNMGLLILVACMAVVASWLFIHRLKQCTVKGYPKTWPLVGAAIEQLLNYDQMHDWILKYLAQSRTVVVPMPFTTYTYIADPTNVEHVLKTNFGNYPKVCLHALPLSFFLLEFMSFFPILV